LYADRRRLASAARAAELWSNELDANPRSFESAWKLARACYWLGGHAAEKERRPWLERGIDAGQRASSIEPNRPEGHFWTAANMGALAESAGLRAGMKYRGPIKQELELVLRLEPGFMAGSADRALGRWYFKVPRLFGGSNKTKTTRSARGRSSGPSTPGSDSPAVSTPHVLVRTTPGVAHGIRGGTFQEGCGFAALASAWPWHGF
jgi:hypothetical protein